MSTRKNTKARQKKQNGTTQVTSIRSEKDFEIFESIPLGKVGIAFFVVLIGVWFLNRPIDSTDFYDIGGQLLITVGFAALGIWIADGKRNGWKKAYIFGILAALAFLFWNLSTILKPIECTTDVILFKDGSGSLLAPQIYAASRYEEGVFSGELSGYDEMDAIDQWANSDIKNDALYNQKLIATASLSWMNKNRLDWSGCEAEPMFIGLSGGSQGINCKEEPEGIEIKLDELLGHIGKDRKFFSPPDTIMKVFSGSNAITLIEKNDNVKMTLSFLDIKFGEELRPHIEGTLPKGIEDNIARFYKARPKPLSDRGFRVTFTLESDKWNRWSVKTKDYQKRAELFCHEYERAFSWKLLKEKLGISFPNEIE